MKNYICKVEPNCEVQCDGCKSFYQRMYDRNHKVNDMDDIYDISAFEWMEYIVGGTDNDVEDM